MEFIFWFVVVVCVYLILSSYGATYGCDDCDHDREVRGAQQLYNVNTSYGIPLTPVDEGEPITKVLYRCRDCGEVTTETLAGHWTFKQLTGQEEEENERVPSRTDGDSVVSGDNPDGASSNGAN